MISKFFRGPDREKYRRVLVYLKPYRGQFALAVVCMAVFGASDGAVPFLVKHVLDGVFARQDRSLLYIIPAVLVLFAVVRAAAEFGQQYLMSRVGHLVVRDLRNQINSHLLKFAPDYFVTHSSGDLVSRITSDVVMVRSLLTDTVVAVIRDVLRITALLVAAVYLDPWLALMAFVLFPVGIVPVYRFGRKMRRLSKIGQDAIGRLSAMLYESIIGNRVIKIFGREQHEVQRFKNENSTLTDTFVRSEKVRALSGPVNEVLASLAISGVILYGGLSVMSGVRTQGDFIAFLLSVFLLYDPFKKLSRVNATVQQGMSGMDRIFEVLDARPAIESPVDPEELGPGNSIEFDHVFFSYDGEKPALRDISLQIEERSLVALVGFSGAGKSTMVDLIARFIDPRHGRIRLGGVDISRVDLDQLRSRLAMVGQHTFLFNDTIYNNIAYGRAGASREEVVEAARTAYALDFISMLPHKFETVIGESGFALSGGERQRIAIARAILKNAPVLILDEATASLDSRSEREVQLALDALEKNRTTVVIAHRLSTVRNADMIVVLRDGEIVEKGRHEELLKLNGEYARLHALQFAGDPEEGAYDEPLVN